MAIIAQRFVLSKEVVEAMTVEEVEATYRDMEEFGIARPPYDRFEILVPSNSIFRVMGEPDAVAAAYVHQERLTVLFRYPEAIVFMRLANGTLIDVAEAAQTFPEHHRDKITLHDVAAELPILAELYRKGLIVLLATRNVVKTTTADKLARLGIGKHKSRALYTTTLTLGRVTEVHAGHAATGRTVRPHLRRGHPRYHQHYGPGNTLEKAIFIPPSFVNADSSFMDSRTAYNVRVT